MQQDTIEKLRLALMQREDYCSLLPFDLRQEPSFVFDFTRANETLTPEIICNPALFSKYVFEELEKRNLRLGIGKYNEDRTIYSWSALFDATKEARTIHLGIDLWVREETPLFAPIDGKVHSFQDNAAAGDYGPTIILQHEISGITFYTLYGHLSRTSLNELFVGKPFLKGQQFATVGSLSENGNWPSHVHFQLITNMLGKKGDFPGVATQSEREKYLALCPDPDVILRLKNEL